jgi:tRNA pseudouridine13 synthase
VNDHREQLPFVTGEIAGIGGRIKSEASAFIVEEVPLYEPCGAGEHVYLTIRREGATTSDVLHALARAFGVHESAIGCAGQKDKHARTTQTFSIALATGDADDVARRAAGELEVEVLSARRHANKLRRGHLLANRFDILIESCGADALARAREIVLAIQDRGLANFYGPQRFGADGRNAERGRDRLASSRRDWTSRFLVSAYQASLFNMWLAERMRRGDFRRILDGDVAKRTDNGALFDVADAAVEGERMERGEITYSGPIFGARMRGARGAAGELEAAILRESGVSAADFARAGARGTRRAARIGADELRVEAALGAGGDPAVRVRVRLPKGAYATVLLREIMKSDATLAALDDEA